MRRTRTPKRPDDDEKRWPEGAMIILIVALAVVVGALFLSFI